MASLDTLSPQYVGGSAATVPAPAVPLHEALLSVVIPVFNESEGLAALHERLTSVLDALPCASEIVLVDDGSSDNSGAMLRDLAQRDPRVVAVGLSRNFGKEIATSAGLDHASGDAVVVLDADLQDPPEEIGRMLEAWQRGYDNVLMRRSSREGETWAKKQSSKWFYRVLQRIGDVEIPPDVGDFRLMSRRCVLALRQCGERARYMKGLFAWVGYPSITLEYEREARHAGTTKWNYRRLWNLAIEGITSFSTAPLKAASYVGFAVALSAFAYAAYVFVKALLYGDPARGYPSLMVMVMFLGGTQLLALGIIGEYLARVFVEVKQRPLYLVASVDTQRNMAQRQLALTQATDGAVISTRPEATTVAGPAPVRR